MDNRFGLKDLILYVLVLGVGVAVVLSMMQADRNWTRMRQLDTKLAEIQTSTARVQQMVQQGGQGSASIDSAALAGAVQALRDEMRAILANAGSASGAGDAPPRTAQPSGDPGDGTGTRGAPGTGDREWWARPGGVKVEWPTRWGPPNDPRQLPDYKEGGTITEVFEGKPVKITPFLLNDVYATRIWRETVCEALANYDHDELSYEGWLAEAWQFDPEGMWLRVKIDDRACFSDGEPLTADDVRFTVMDYVFNPEVESPVYKATMDSIADVVVIADKVVEYRFKEPTFTNFDSAMRHVVLPRHFFEQFTPEQLNQSTGLVMGSGPYRLEAIDPNNQWTPDRPLELVRNEFYWGVRPPIERQRYKFINDYTAILTEFENGGAEIVRCTSEQYERKMEDESFDEFGRALAWTNMRSGYTFIAWQCGERNGRLTPFHDKRVRRAMTLLMDRDRINRDFYASLGDVSTGPFNPKSAQADPSIQPLPYDPAEARRLLAEAGWQDRDGDGHLENERGDRFTFEFTYTTSPFAEKVSTYLIDQCASVGITVTLRKTEWAAMEAIRKQRDFDALTQAWSWSAPESDPIQIFHSKEIKGEGDNWMQWANPEADRLIDEARRTIDPVARAQLWHRLHQVIVDDQPYTFVLNVPWLRLVNNKVENVHMYNIGIDKMEMFIP